MQDLRRHPRLPLFVLFALAVAGLAVRAHFARLDVFPSVDGVFYLEQGRTLVLHHRLPFSTFPPGWPVLASLPLWFRDPTDALQVLRSAQLVNVVLGTLWPVLTFFLLRRDLDPWRALLGAAVLLALPLGITASKGDLSETSFGCLLLTVFLLLPRRRFLAGLFLGYAYLVRPEALVVAVGVAAWLGWRERRVPWGLLAGVVPFVMAYVLFLHRHTGEWALTGKLGFLAGAWRRHEGGAFWALMGRNLGTLLLLPPRQLGIPLVGLALLGLWRRPRFVYLAFLALLPLLFFDFTMSSRYWLPYLPFVLLAAGRGAEVLVAALPPTRRRVVAAGLLVVVLGGVLLVSGDDAVWVRENPDRYDGLRAAGLWLRPHVADATKVAAYKPFASFWAGCEFVKYPPSRDIWHLLDMLELLEVDYLVVNAHVAKVFEPNLLALLGKDVDPRLKQRVEPLQVIAYDVPDQFTVVYRLNPAAPS